MKSRAQIADELVALVQRHYYSEDFELLSAARAYHEQLDPAEREALRDVVAGRLLQEGTLVDVLLCSALEIPEAAPRLASLLLREESASQMSRALIQALQHYGGDEAYRAVERFLDSEQESEALRALAAIDFVRALPHLARLLDQEHHLDTCLHILYERRKRVGLPRLLHELQAASALQPRLLRDRLRRSLRAKTGEYNPFSEADLRALEAILRTPSG